MSNSSNSSGKKQERTQGFKQTANEFKIDDVLKVAKRQPRGDTIDGHHAEDPSDMTLMHGFVVMPTVLDDQVHGYNDGGPRKDTADRPSVEVGFNFIPALVANRFADRIHRELSAIGAVTQRVRISTEAHFQWSLWKVGRGSGGGGGGSGGGDGGADGKSWTTEWCVSGSSRSSLAG